MMKRLLTMTVILALAGGAMTASALADEATARKLLNSQGCKGCHIFDGNGGKLGPALDGIGKTMSAKQIREKLLNPKATNANSVMPAFGHLPEADINALVDFLSQQK